MGQALRGLGSSWLGCSAWWALAGQTDSRLAARALAVRELPCLRDWAGVARWGLAWQLPMGLPLWPAKWASIWVMGLRPNNKRKAK